MDVRRTLMLDAMTRALEVRQHAGLQVVDPVNVFDLAEQRGLEVRFVDIPSMEGIYYKQARPTILVSSLRPPGRQAFTCAHELGHDIFGHGTQLDELLDQPLIRRQFQPKEFLADSFAASLLMPKTTVSWAFTCRGWTTQTCTAQQAFVVAGWLGVGYTTLLYHMSQTLGLLSPQTAAPLIKISPARIRADLLGSPWSNNLVVIDAQWTKRAIDISVGDLILADAEIRHETAYIAVQHRDQHRSVFCGHAPGMGQLHNERTGWSAFVRVARKDYVGRNMFRHLEDPDE